MASTEAQQNCAKILKLQNMGTAPETKNENKKLPSTRNEQDGPTTVDDTAKEKETVADKIDPDKETTKATNCDKMTDENKDEITVVENNDELNTRPTQKRRSLQTVEKSDTSADIENDSDISNNDDVKETVVTEGNSMKRKRSDPTAQETGLPSEESNTRSRRKKTRNTTDRFCWRCHKKSVDAHCSACPRSWHRKCIGGMQPSSVQNWICGECAAILKAENAETRSITMAHLSVDQLCTLLKHVVDKMRDYPGSEPFWKPVELSEAPNYLDYVVKPMDLTLLGSNVQAKLYGSTDAFMADAKWIQHNCIVFNTCGGVYADTSKLTNAAKQIIKLARQEVSEIEACPDCYGHVRNLPRPQPAWFIEPCRYPHPLVWAKLKGFPFWPAKAMPRVNSQGFVDVRFFGEHDRAWIPPRDLYLYSEEPPVPLPRKRKLDMDDCVREITRHCRKLELAFGQFKYAPPKVQYNPHDPMQIKVMLPNYDPLHPNNSISTQLFVAEKKPSPKKRAPVSKIKTLNEIEMNPSDNESKTVTDQEADARRETEVDKIESKKLKLDKTEKSNETKLISNSYNDGKTSVVNETRKTEIKEEAKLANTVTDVKIKQEDAKPGPSKIKEINKTSLIEQSEDSRSIATPERNSSGQKSADERKPLENLSKQTISSVQNSLDNVHPQKQATFLKANAVKGDTLQNSSNVQKTGLKVVKTAAKVYKPKTRMVDKVNAERALKSISANEQNQKSNAQGALQNESSLSKEAFKNFDNNFPPSPVSTSNSKSDSNSGRTATPDIQTPGKTADQPVTLFLVVNNSTPETAKHSLRADKEKSNDVPAVVQHVPKDVERPLQKKESKARKSFPNRARISQQVISHTPPPSAPSTLLDTLSYVPVHQIGNSNVYEMVPPEAGPASARLYHGAQDLARKMAQLMEEAYKEAAQESSNCNNGSSENHKATVHILRLQIERMRWQHQQQLAELKHNTDRILREMRASLEAERLRAIEETRKELEEENVRFMEEIKRKQWCAVCGHEALYYCCCNTAYCDYACQQSHWPTHMRTCGQQAPFATTSPAANSNQQQVMPRLMINKRHILPNIRRA